MTERATTAYDVVVVGAGIVGLSTALELAGRGRHVLVVDRGPIDGGCALGSAGHLVPSHVVPLAAPGALRATVTGLLRKQGALSIKWSMDPAFWRWLVGFVRSCTARAVQTAAPALRDLARLSDEIWDDWLTASDQPVLTDGLFDVYAENRAFERAMSHVEELRRWGVAADVVDSTRAMTMEPALLPPVAGGVLLRDDRSIHPEVALADLIRRVDAAGVWLMPFAEVVDVDAIDDRIAGVRTTRGDIKTSEFVLAAGAWSGRLAQLLGERVPMLAGRGLSLTVDRPEIGPRRPMLLGEDHVAIGPMGDELRLTAWFQLNNLDTTVSVEWIRRLEAIARRRLRLDESLVARRRWAGMRPVTPDGVPIIGPSTRWRNVTIAAGHSMIGLTLGPGTGRIVAQLVCGEAPEIPIDRFSPRRFS
jgi:D-amino-acid dehydrogenase